MTLEQYAAAEADRAIRLWLAHEADHGCAMEQPMCRVGKVLWNAYVAMRELNVELMPAPVAAEGEVHG